MPGYTALFYYSIVGEFLYCNNTGFSKARKKNHTLSNWGVKNHPEKIRECVKAILSEDFKKYGADRYRLVLFDTKVQ